MLERPAIQDGEIVAFLEEEYAISTGQVTFLPLGADTHTAVYAVTAGDGTPYFLKLRSGRFDSTAVLLPRYLRSQGIMAVLAPLETRAGRLWIALDGFMGIVYPYVRGYNAYDRGLSDRQWRNLGIALRQVHELSLPPELQSAIRQEAYAPDWRNALRRHLDRIDKGVYKDELAADLAAFLTARRAQVLDLVRRAARLAEVLQAETQERVLCHSDLHAGNFLMADGGDFYIVDWDDPILAPRERDLMFVGGGLMGGWRTPSQEEALFFEGYGPTRIDPVALAYYRYERIVVDLAEFCSQILPAHGSLEDRQQSLGFLQSNFLPGGTIEIARQAERSGLA